MAVPKTHCESMYASGSSAAGNRANFAGILLGTNGGMFLATLKIMKRHQVVWINLNL